MARMVPLIPLADYQRVFRVIYSVLESTESHTANACLFFSLAGAAILEKFYKKHALPIAGSAFYWVDNANRTVVSLSQRNAGAVISSKDSFHCWIHCEGYAVDFMVPIFQESLASAGHSILCPRRMFQKDMARMSESPGALRQEGDFYLQPNFELTKQLLESFAESPLNGDLVTICLNWYKKPPKAIPNQITTADMSGKMYPVRLANLEITGAW